MWFPFRRQKLGATFVHPLHPAPRTAVLASGFDNTKQIRAFPTGWTEKTGRFRPTAVAGSLQTLLALDFQQIELEHALIVFTYDPDKSLGDSDRGILWNRFGVPIFEQLLGSGNQVLAAECEAHDGLHITGEITGMDLDFEPCGCGRMEPRLLRWTPVRRMAATA